MCGMRRQERTTGSVIPSLYPLSQKQLQGIDIEKREAAKYLPTYHTKRAPDRQECDCE